MADGEKICVLCGQSCVGQPRIKNEKGQYAHRACVQAKQEQTQEPAGINTAEDDGAYGYDDEYDALGGGMDDLLGDMDAQPEIGSASACGGCGQRMEDGAVVCMSCGFNAQSGRAMSTKSKEVGEGIGGAALGGVAKVGGLAASPMLPFIGALIGGAIGAAIWAAIAYFTGYEVGYVAIGVGALCGFGAQLGGGAQTSGGGAIAGAMAAIIAMGAIAGGKYAAVYYSTKDLFQSEFFQELAIEDIDDEMLITGLADAICDEQTLAGIDIPWNPQLFVDAALWPEDYPIDIQNETRDHWDAMTGLEKNKFRKAVGDEYDVSMSEVDHEWAKQSLADQICSEKIAADEQIDWPDRSLPIRIATWPEDYPQMIQDLTDERLAAMSDAEKDDLRYELLDKFNLSRSMSGDFAQEVTKQGFINSFKHPLDIAFMFFAVFAAYGIASNE